MQFAITQSSFWSAGAHPPVELRRLKRSAFAYLAQRDRIFECLHVTYDQRGAMSEAREIRVKVSSGYRCAKAIA
jgi:hypothetical protein